MSDEEREPLIPRADSLFDEVATTPAAATVAGTGWLLSAFIVVNAALGAGLLDFPKAFDTAGGVAVAMIVQATLLVFIVGALLILAYCSDVQQSATYQDVVKSVCGALPAHICSLCIALYCFGTCITFFIIIGDQWDRFLSLTAGKDFCLKWYLNRKFTMSITSVFLILPLCFPKRIDFLKWPSAVGVVGILYITFMVGSHYVLNDVKPEARGVVKTGPDTWSDVFTVIPTICFGYQCHVSVVPVYSCLQPRNLFTFGKSLVLAMLLCMAAYSITAICGYLTFGSKVYSDILQNYDQTPDVLVGLLLMAAKIYTTYPILNFCGRAALDSVLIAAVRPDPVRVADTEKTRRWGITLTWFVTSLICAIAIPNIGDVIGVLGGLAAVFIFVFPGLCLLSLTMDLYQQENYQKMRTHFLLAVSCLYLVIGTFLFGVTTVQAVYSDINEKKPASSSTSDNPCPTT